MKAIKVLLPVFLFVLFLINAPSLKAQTTASTDVSANTPTVTLKNKIRDSQAAKSQLQDTMVERKALIQAKRLEVQTKVKEARAIYKSKIEAIRDGKKKLVVERIDSKTETVNNKATDRMLGVLDKLESILKNITEKVSAAKAKGYNTASVELAIQDAKSVIDSAKTILTEQAAKSYVLEVDESALRQTVGSTVSQLRLDLQASHKAVIDAKQAVMNAVRELAKLRAGVVTPTVSVAASPTIEAVQ